MRTAIWTVGGAVVLACFLRRAAAGDPPPAGPSPEVSAAAADLRSPDLERRRKAAFAVWNFGPAAKDILPAVAAALRDDDEYVRTTADKVLATFRMEKSFGTLETAIPELLTGLADPRVEVRRLAVGNLWRVGWPTKPPPATLAPALVKALSDPDAKVRASAAAVVANFPAYAQEAFPALRPLLTDPDKEVRLWAVQAYGALRPPEAAPGLVKALADVDPKVRAAAAAGLSFPHESMSIAVPALVKALSDPDKDVRIAAAGAFLNLGFLFDVSSAVAPLVAMLKDPDPNVRAAAAAGLEGAGSATAVGELKAIVASEQAADLRAAAASALGALGPEDVPRVLEALQDALQDSEEPVRQAAASSLGTLGRAALGAAPGLLGALRDGQPSVRGAAAQSLGKVGASSDEVVEAMTAALGDSDAGVRSVAAEALADLRPTAKETNRGALAALRTEKNAGTRMSLTRLLVFAGAPAAEILSAVDASAAPAPAVDVPAAFARARLSGDAAAVQAAVSSLTSLLGSEESRWAALFALRLLGPAAAPAVPAIEALRVGAEISGGYAAVYDGALLQIPGPSAKLAFERVLTALRKGDTGAAMTLGFLGREAAPAVPDLVAASAAKDSRVRTAALDALGKIGVVSDAVKAALEVDRKDPLFRVRRAAYDAQSRLGILPK